jgi:hypothetical protein
VELGIRDGSATLSLEELERRKSVCLGRTRGEGRGRGSIVIVSGWRRVFAAQAELHVGELVLAVVVADEQRSPGNCGGRALHTGYNTLPRA